jgi:hypothetical protein
MNIDTITLTHIGIECVVIAGMGVWFNKRIGTLETENSELKEELKKMEQRMLQYEQILTKHNAILGQIMGVNNSPTGRSSANDSPSSQPLGDGRPNHGNIRRDSGDGSTPSSANDPSKDEGDTVDPNQLDNLLAEELSNLKQPKPTSSSKQYTKIEIPISHAPKPRGASETLRGREKSKKKVIEKGGKTQINVE